MDNAVHLPAYSAAEKTHQLIAEGNSGSDVSFDKIRSVQELGSTINPALQFQMYHDLKFMWSHAPNESLREHPILLSLSSTLTDLFCQEFKHRLNGNPISDSRLNQYTGPICGRDSSYPQVMELQGCKRSRCFVDNTREAASRAIRILATAFNPVQLVSDYARLVSSRTKQGVDIHLEFIDTESIIEIEQQIVDPDTGAFIKVKIPFLLQDLLEVGQDLLQQIPQVMPPSHSQWCISDDYQQCKLMN